MVFVVNELKIIQYKNLESQYKYHIEAIESHNKIAEEIHQEMLFLSNEILKEAGVI